MAPPAGDLAGGIVRIGVRRDILCGYPLGQAEPGERPGAPQARS